MIRGARGLSGALLAGALAAGLAACQGAGATSGYTIVARLPHDTAAYTQGLLMHGGILYESTGLYGFSQLRRVDLATGRVLASVALPAERFGEGLALHEGRLYQLTWTSNVGYVYDLASLARVDSFNYRGEGWGLTSDGTSLIMSDGTPTLRYADPRGFAITREVTVRDGNSPLSGINELEYRSGEIFANIYQSNWIVRIDPDSGRVLGWLDLADLVPEHLRHSTENVLNGIAVDPLNGDLLVTGKRWPILYRIRLDSTAPGSRRQ